VTQVRIGDVVLLLLLLLLLLLPAGKAALASE
jgi:hypothetical protein